MPRLARSRALFVVTLLVLSLPILWRLFWIYPLYLDAGQRPRIERAMRTVADREGWILSDMDLKAVETPYDDIVVYHHPHMRGAIAAVCYRINLTSAQHRPCSSDD